MDIHFVIKELNIDVGINFWLLLSILLTITIFVLFYILMSGYFIFQLTKRSYKREFTYGLPYGIVIKGNLNEDSVLNDMNNKLIKAEKENKRLAIFLIVLTILFHLNNKFKKDKVNKVDDLDKYL